MFFNKLHFCLGASLLVLLSGCASKPSGLAYVGKGKLESFQSNTSMQGEFCAVKSRSLVGRGIAISPFTYQQYLGECSHPKWDKKDVVVIYFGEPTLHGSPAQLEEELDYSIHPNEYLTDADTQPVIGTIDASANGNYSPSNPFPGSIFSMLTLPDVVLGSSQMNLLNMGAPILRMLQNSQHDTSTLSAWAERIVDAYSYLVLENLASSITKAATTAWKADKVVKQPASVVENVKMLHAQLIAISADSASAFRNLDKVLELTETIRRTSSLGGAVQQ